MASDKVPLYEINWRVLDTMENGIPQSRKRWYCVGLRKDQFKGGLEGETSSFKWAEKIPCPPISDFLDDWHSLDKPHIALQPSATARKNIQRAEESIMAKGKDPRQVDVIVDCDASYKSMRQYHEFSPCITKSRDRGALDNESK